MSLSTFIKVPAHRNKIKAYFPRPCIKLQGNIKSPPLSKSPIVIGTAADYLIRFKIKYLFPKAKENSWVAEKTKFSSNAKRLIKYVNRAKERYAKYLSNGKLSRDLIKSSIDLAKIDIYVRSGYYPAYMGKYNKDDITDLNNILKNIDFEKFNFKKRCLLNPTFGWASRDIGGADADLIIDNLLIDIKTTRKLIITREMLNQIVGYFFLGCIGKVKGVKDWSSINEFGFFFSRFDLLYTIPVKEFILTKKRNSFEKWFKTEVENFNLFEISAKMEQYLKFL